MKIEKHLLNNAFLEGQSSCDILANLYGLFQEHHRNPSLENFAKALNIPSRGYLSNVLSKKINLGEKHLEGIARYFNLSYAQKDYFLLTIQREKKKKVLLEINLENEINKRKKIIQTRDIEKLSSPPLIVSFILGTIYIKKQIKIKDLIMDLSSFDKQKVTFAIEELSNAGIIKETPSEQFSLIENKSIYLNFKDYNDTELENNFEEIIGHIKKGFFNNYKNSEKAYFESSVITVQEKQLEPIIKEVKKKIDLLKADLQDDDGPDSLLSFHMQVFQKNLLP